MSDPFTSCGKQILRSKEHVADACNEPTAEAITIMLNKGRFVCSDITEEEFAKVREVLWK